MPAELKNCPFCGAEALVDFLFVGPMEQTTVWYIKCCNCESCTKFHATESGAAETWNRRAENVDKIANGPTTDAGMPLPVPDAEFANDNG